MGRHTIKLERKDITFGKEKMRKGREDKMRKKEIRWGREKVR